MADAMAPIAKLAWLDAFSSEMREFPLLEGGSASIGPFRHQRHPNLRRPHFARACGGHQPRRRLHH